MVRIHKNYAFIFLAILLMLVMTACQGEDVDPEASIDGFLSLYFDQLNYTEEMWDELAADVARAEEDYEDLVWSEYITKIGFLRLAERDLIPNYDLKELQDYTYEVGEMTEGDVGYEIDVTLIGPEDQSTTETRTIKIMFVNATANMDEAGLITYLQFMNPEDMTSRFYSPRIYDKFDYEFIEYDAETERAMLEFDVKAPDYSGGEVEGEVVYEIVGDGEVVTVPLHILAEGQFTGVTEFSVYDEIQMKVIRFTEDGKTDSEELYPLITTRYDFLPIYYMDYLGSMEYKEKQDDIQPVEFDVELLFIREENGIESEVEELYFQVLADGEEIVLRKLDLEPEKLNSDDILFEKYMKSQSDAVGYAYEVEEAFDMPFGKRIDVNFIIKDDGDRYYVNTYRTMKTTPEGHVDEAFEEETRGYSKSLEMDIIDEDQQILFRNSEKDKYRY